ALGPALSPDLHPAAAAPDRTELPERANFGYKFYVGGVLIGKAWMSTSFADGRYRSQGSVETDGVAGWFVSATVVATADGAMGDDQPTPVKLDVTGVTDKTPWRMSIDYDGGAPTGVFSEPPFREKPYEIDPRRQGGALDPVSAVIATLTPMKGSGCDRVIPIFDGRKRYDIVIGPEIERGVSRKGFPMVECEARWRRVGGFKGNQMNKPDVPFTARFERRDGLAVPTKVWGDTEFGGAVAIIRE
ncbi:MAG: DUF3108 domain-containing protein, partial [Pseudomonadota bacterium]